MTDQLSGVPMGPEELQPTFEVYPPAATASEPAPVRGWEPDPAEPLWEQPGAVSPGGPVPVPAGPGALVPADPPGPDRRTVFRIGMGIAVAAVALSAVAQFRVADDEDVWVPDDVAYEDDQQVEVGGYLASVPQGWTLRTTSAAEAVVTNGSNRLEVYAFNAAEGDRAADLVKELVRLRRGGFSGRLGQVSDTSREEAEVATVSATGTVAGSPARLIGQLWIGPDARALLVVRVLTAPEGALIDMEARDLTQALSYQHGGPE